MPAMRTIHYSGAATTTPAKVTLSVGLAQRINVRNLDGTNGLDVSFDGGRSFYTILATSVPLDIACSLHFFWVRSTAAVVNWCAVTNEG